MPRPKHNPRQERADADAKRLRGYSKDALVLYLVNVQPMGIAWSWLDRFEEMARVDEFLALIEKEKELSKRLTPAILNRIERECPTARDIRLAKPVARARRRIRALESLLSPVLCRARPRLDPPTS